MKKLTVYSYQWLRIALSPLFLLDPTVENWRPAQQHSVNDSENAARQDASMGATITMDVHCFNKQVQHLNMGFIKSNN